MTHVRLLTQRTFFCYHAANYIKSGMGTMLHIVQYASTKKGSIP